MVKKVNEEYFDTYFDLERSANTLTKFINSVVDVMESSDDTSDKDIRNTVIFFNKLYDKVFNFVGTLGEN